MAIIDFNNLSDDQIMYFSAKANHQVINKCDKWMKIIGKYLHSSRIHENTAFNTIRQALCDYIYTRRKNESYLNGLLQERFKKMNITHVPDIYYSETIFLNTLEYNITILCSKKKVINTDKYNYIWIYGINILSSDNLMKAIYDEHMPDKERMILLNNDDMKSKFISLETTNLKQLVTTLLIDPKYMVNQVLLSLIDLGMSHYGFVLINCIYKFKIKRKGEKKFKEWIYYKLYNKKNGIRQLKFEQELKQNSSNLTNLVNSL